MSLRTLFARPVITRRDDAALPHEPLPDLLDGETLEPTQLPYDDGADGNSTPNGGI